MQEKTYDWSHFEEKVKALGYRSVNAWAHANGFNRKTVHSLKSGWWSWGRGPKAEAIIRKALQDGLIDEVNCKAG